MSASRPLGWTGRLLLVLALVVLAAVATAAAVTAIAGPAIFHEHLLSAGVPLDSEGVTHVEMAFRDATAIALAVATVIALLVAVVASLVVARRLNQPLDALTRTAADLSQGHFDARVPPLHSGTSLDALADTVNDMAQRVETTEATRRRMLADLAHELRTPLTVLTAYHDGLADGIVTLDEETSTVLAEQTARLARLAEDIEEVSTAEERGFVLNIAPVPARDLLGTAATALRDQYDAKGVALTVETEDTSVDVDTRRMGQVLTNLLTNALRHTPTGGKVRLVGERRGAGTVIQVTDDGEGIAADHLPHLFERFYRGDPGRSRAGGGSGIGLTISRAIVAAHGGTLVATSAGRGKGATFTVTLPGSAPAERF